MTLILPRKDIAKDFITGGQNNVGLRVPAQPLAIALLKQFEVLGGQGIAAPSANRFGAVSPTTAEAVAEEIGDYLETGDQVLNGGQCLVGLESTIIDCTEFDPRILRPGFVTLPMIEDVTKKRINLNENQVKAPGMLDSHYSPIAKVFLNAPTNTGDGFIALANIETPNGAYRLGAPESVEQYAKELYSMLRKADSEKISRVISILPPKGGIADAIIDRLTKASFLVEDMEINEFDFNN
jgi:L-threonylcarbamoyladenylate synthase